MWKIIIRHSKVNRIRGRIILDKKSTFLTFVHLFIVFIVYFFNDGFFLKTKLIFLSASQTTFNYLKKTSVYVD